ncbi:LytR family transcriptional regulator [bacterium]|nr:MAG: LytR family transcriptional regulator [bacterium]
MPTELETEIAPDPFLPSEPVAPKPRRKKSFWKGFGLTVLIVGAAGLGLLLSNPMVRDFGPSVFKSPNLIFDTVGQDHVNILLIGEDRNWKQGMVFDPTIGKMRPHQVIDTDSRPRADTIIVCSLDKSTHKIRFLSLPRDTRVQYRDFDGDMHPSDSRDFVKLNSVYAHPDGAKLLSKVIGEEFGIRIDRVAKIKLEGFNKLIDRVGGIDINVEGGLFNGKRGRMIQEDKWGGWKVDLMPGMQHLDADQAHGYVRYRKDNEGDPGRVRRQQQVMRALAKKMTTVSLVRLPGLAAEIQKLFISNLSNDEMVSAARFAKSLGDPAQITPLTPFGIYKGSDIVMNRPENLKLFKTIFGSSFSDKHFLELSPETSKDAIGSRNNNNPAALAVMREAGLTKTKKVDSEEARVEAPGLQ